MLRSLIKSKDFFNVNDLVKVESLLEARVHFGHKEDHLNGHMRPYIFGKRLGVLIIDLEKTASHLKKALNVTAEIAYRNGIILFAHQCRQNGQIVERAAKECGEFAHCRRWSDKIFTQTVKTFGAVTRLPDLCIWFSTVHMEKPHPAIRMASKVLVPTIGICDTNADPRLVTYPIPGNDDSPQSIAHFSDLFRIAVTNGKAKRKEVIDKYGEDFYYKTHEHEYDDEAAKKIVEQQIKQ